MSTVTVIAQVLGIAAMTMNVLSLQCRSNQKLFIMQEIGGVLFTISFAMLGAWSGALMNLFGAVRPEILRRPSIASSPWTLAGLLLFLLLCGLSAVFIFGDAWYLILLSGTAQVAGTCCMWSQNGKWIRLGQLFFVSPLWLAYNLVLPIPSIGGILSEVINITSGIVALFRYRKTGFTR